MKNLKLIFATICFLLFTTNIKAQQDPNCGVYLNNIKVTQIDCYSFDEMSVVFQNKPEYKSYSLVRFTFYVKTPSKANDGSEFIIGSASIDLSPAMFEGNYIIMRVFSKGKQDADVSSTSTVQHFSRGLLNYYSTKTEDTITFGGNLVGLTKVGLEEKYNSSCNCMQWQTIYNETGLAFTPDLVLNNRKKIGLLAEADLRDVDLSAPCDIQGTKVDFSNLGK